MTPRLSKARLVTSFSFALTLVGAGCNTDPLYRDPQAPRGPVMSAAETVRPGLEANVGLSVVEPQEVDLVEALLTHRSDYYRTLEALRDYYREHGYVTKQAWADYELAGLGKVKTFRYLIDAEVPSDPLRPVNRIPEADALFDKGLEQMRHGGHGVPIFYRESVMVEAADTFRTLIDQYPASDKVDDAAFFLGEIHKEYLKEQEMIAVKWYERAWTWDPHTPHPARFQAAVVCDYRLHDRDRALELYKSVLQDETADLTNVRFSTRRIEELTAANRTTRASLATAP